MKKKLMALLIVAGGSLFAETHFSIGVNIGGPRYVAPVAVAAYRPAYPGPGYVWVDGYTDEYGHFVNGYWALPPYTGAYWVAPRFVGGRFNAGFWGGERHENFVRGHERTFEHGREFGRGFRR